MIKEENLKFFINSLSNEQLGKVIRELITPSNILFSDSEKYIFDILKSEYQIITSKQTNYKLAALKRWQKRKAEQTQKEQKEDLPKRDLPIQQTNFKKSIYNNYKQLPLQNTQQTQKEKEFIKDYQKRGVLTI